MVMVMAEPSTDLEVIHHDAERGIIPATDMRIIPPEDEMRMLFQMALVLSAAAAVPAALRQKPNDVFLVLLTARDLGISLTTAVRECHVIDGKVTVSPKLKKAMVAERGLGNLWPGRWCRAGHGAFSGAACTFPVADGRCGDEGHPNDEKAAAWYGERHDQPGRIIGYEFTMAEALEIKIKGNDRLAGKDNWKNYPKRMLSWRALGALLDDLFSEVGTGLYAPDELGAVTDEDGVPLDIIDVEMPRGMTEPGVMRNARRKDEPPDLIPDDEREALIARRAALPEGCKDELRAKWNEKDEAGIARIGRLDLAPARVAILADALLKSFEARAKKGEWGSWPAPTPEAKVPPADDAEPVDAEILPGAPVAETLALDGDPLEAPFV
jgi:hypothetical protein